MVFILDFYFILGTDLEFIHSFIHSANKYS